MSLQKSIISENNITKLYIAGILIFAVAMFYFLGSILTPFLIALFLAYIGNPLVAKLKAYGMSRNIAAAIVFTLIFLGISLLLLISIPIIQKQLSTLIALVPHIFIVGITKLNTLLSYFNLDTVDPESLQKMVTEHFSQPDGALWLWQTTIKSGKALVDLVIGILVIPFVTFYLLRDWKERVSKFKKLIPQSHHVNLISIFNECEKALSAFLRGQMSVVLCMSGFYVITLTLAGLKVGIVVGLLMGAFTILPYIGSIIGLAIACVAALAQTGEITPLIWVLLSYSVGHVVENFYLAPKFIGGKIGLDPVQVIFVILAGGTLFGIWGLILALPISSVAVTLLKHLYDSNDERKETPAVNKKEDAAKQAC